MYAPISVANFVVTHFVYFFQKLFNDAISIKGVALMTG
jgi:hypothetical protein